MVKRSRTPDNKTRAKAAFMPGQARAIRVVNGKMQVETAMSRSDLAQKIAEEKKALEEDTRTAAGAVQSADIGFKRVPSHSSNRRPQKLRDQEADGGPRELEEMAADVVDMMDRFDRVHKGMCEQLSQAGV